jgi:putative ABC transport system ATP-binding protein
MFLVGGIFVFDGTLTLGALVAMLAASKDIRSPMRELLYFYRDFSIARVGYRLIHDNMTSGALPG